MYIFLLKNDHFGAGPLWCSILAIYKTERLVQTHNKKTELPWCYTKITIRSCWQVFDSEPESEDKRWGSSQAWVFCPLPWATEEAKAAKTRGTLQLLMFYIGSHRHVKVYHEQLLINLITQVCGVSVVVLYS